MSEGVRGRPASSQTVDLYRLLHEADHPMTLDEIAAEVGGMPSAYRTAANIAYREHLPQLNRHGLPVKDTEPWTDADRDAAWRWWLGELVNSCRIKGLVIVTAQDGSDPNGKPRSKLAYTANRDHPPVTWAWGIGRRTAYWTPEIAATGARHLTGMRFLQESDELSMKPKTKTEAQLRKRVAELERINRLGVTAIRVPRQAAPGS